MQVLLRPDNPYILTSSQIRDQKSLIQLQYVRYIVDANEQFNIKLGACWQYGALKQS